MIPIQLLQKELSSLKKALKKSRIALFNRKIDYETHKTHYNNLAPKIRLYKEAINKLKEH